MRPTIWSERKQNMVAVMASRADGRFTSAILMIQNSQEANDYRQQ